MKKKVKLPEFPEIHRYPYFACDVETTGLKFWEDKLFAFALATPDGGSWYYDIRHKPKALEWAKKELKRGKLLINHATKFDAHFMRESGVELPNLVCTMIRAALIDEHLSDFGGPDMGYSLDALSKRYLDKKKVDIYPRLAEIFGGKPTRVAQMPNLHKAPVELAAEYAIEDPSLALDLFHWQEKRILQDDLVEVHKLEHDLLPVIIDMEARGVRVDVKAAERAVDEITKTVKVLQKKLDKIAGFPVNANPSGSIHKLFEPREVAQDTWVACDGTLLHPTESGQNACIDADALRRMKHPAAALILEIRELLKMRDTFLLGHVLSYHHNGIIHPNFNQTKSDNDRGTGTGRLSVNQPALQQITSATRS